MTATKARRISTISFSGAGHLLVYHLGCSLEILRQIRQSNVTRNKKTPSSIQGGNTSTYTRTTTACASGKNNNFLSTASSLPPIKAVAGSSSGAIAAVLFSKLPHRIEEFAEIFINTRGRALETLASMLHDEERHWTASGGGGRSTMSSTIDNRVANNHKPSLHIATTMCKDGSSHLFRFSNNEMYSTISSSWNTDQILAAVKASCTIPPSFHPIDLMPSRWNDELYYPNEEGVYIDGKYHVDGGIAAPAPTAIPTSVPKEAVLPIIVSPVSFGDRSGQDNDLFRISPEDNSWRLLPCRNLKLRGNFLAKPSVQNLRTLRVAGGMTTSAELKDWYERGMEDAKSMIDGLK